MVKGLSKVSIGSFIKHCEDRYLSGTNMFSSRTDFRDFFLKEVKSLLKSKDFVKEVVDAYRDAYVCWATKYHPVEYDPIEKEGINSVIEDCMTHYAAGCPNMFTSRAEFDEFLEKEVRFEARCQLVGFQRAADAYISWAETRHFDEYQKLLATERH